MSSGTLLAVCRVHQLRPDSGTVGITAIDKRPVEGLVNVRPLGLYADVQADRANHGGLDQAIYAYSQEDADFWATELGREIRQDSLGRTCVRKESMPPAQSLASVGAWGSQLFWK